MNIGIINLEIFDIGYIMAGTIISGVLFLFYINKLKKEISLLKKHYEKKSIGADDSALKIKTLENKIQTLETALKKQMEK